jgi:hypothetical protein
MSAATTHPRAPLTHGPRLLLFGRAGAGKSALLGALFQSLAQPSPLFKGRLADDSGGLTDLARGVAADKLEPTAADVVGYPVHFEPQDPGKSSWSATLLDCSGAVAQDYVLGKRALDEPAGLAPALLDADALLLVVDAAGPPKQLEQDFAQLDHFLHLLQDVRSRHMDIAGLPVFLVLTKCDLLARPNDTRSLWMQKIEEGKRRIGQKFQDFLSRPSHRPHFGDLRLHLSATAAQRPALADIPARAEPYGVAELFRECLHAAEAYHQRRDRAGQRLSLTIMGMAALLGVCALAMVLLLFSQPNRELEKLKDQVSDLVPGQALSAAERLRGTPGTLAERLKATQELERQPLYPQLPEQQREATERYLRELAAYLETYQEFQRTIKPPHLARNAEELARFEKGLHEFALPSEYAGDWQDTRLAQRLRVVREEYAALRRAEGAAIQKIHDHIKETRRLRDQGNKFSDDLDVKMPPAATAVETWFSAVAEQLEPCIPFPKGDTIPGVPGLSYEKLDHLPRVRAAAAEARSAQAVLRALADELRGRLRKGTTP